MNDYYFEDASQVGLEPGKALAINWPSIPLLLLILINRKKKYLGAYTVTTSSTYLSSLCK
ncbi:hypothetical protein LOAG_12901, partial [Loa loa]|uniref:6-phospho-beta-glucosidase n=1 Tax=Loa loa TaxID=7209 RepID=A0A1I7VAP6_LOALO